MVFPKQIDEIMVILSYLGCPASCGPAPWVNLRMAARAAPGLAETASLVKSLWDGLRSEALAAAHHAALFQAYAELLQLLVVRAAQNVRCPAVKGPSSAHDHFISRDPLFSA